MSTTEPCTHEEFWDDELVTRPPKGQRIRATKIVTIADADTLDDFLQGMNTSGVDPILPFIDANGIADLAMGQAPSGDDWQVGFVTREPDSGVLAHCCDCCHPGHPCDLAWDWEPAYPIVALVRGGAPE